MPSHRSPRLAFGSPIAGSIALAALALPLVVSGCGDEDRAPVGDAESAAGTTPVVAVVNAPLAFFAERIGGDAIDVRFPAPTDQDPAFWMPDIETIAVYQAADRILLNGLGYAKWTSVVALPTSRLVDTSVAFSNASIATEAGVVHSHGPEGEHDHEGRAFTTWIDFAQAAEQARAVHAALVELAPSRSAEFDRRRDLLVDELNTLDERMRTAGAALADVPLIASHPVYQYWARRYELDVRSVHWEPDAAPTEAQRAELRARLDERAADVLIWEGVPVEAARRAADDLGLESIVFDPCGGPPEPGEDFLDVMERNVAAIERLAAARTGS